MGELAELTDQLVTAVAKLSPNKDSSRAQNMRRRVERVLRPGSHGRTDQFLVARQLEGLQEKFEVVDRSDLTQALRSRLLELEGYSNDWYPEILSLMLQLSNRPAIFSKIENLPKRATAPAQDDALLSWSKLNADTQDTTFNDDIWEEVDFAAGSSDDDFSSVASDVSLPPSPQQPSIDLETEYVVPGNVFVSGDDEKFITSIEKAQFWRPENKAPTPKGKEIAYQTITELQLARETLFMLQGLPTSIFWRLDDEITVDGTYRLRHCSSNALSALLQSFTEIGCQIDALRRFTNASQTIPYMQTFCRGIEERLLEFDANLSQVQVSFLSAGSTVSLIQLLNDVRQYSRHLLQLSDLVSRLGRHIDTQPMSCLDLLYDSICLQEALGNDTTTLVALFSACFRTYSRSIKLWMSTGHLDSQDCAFFVRANPEHGELRTLWHDWYILDDGTRRQEVPSFLENGIHKVFTAGKNMVFLRHLNALPDLSEHPDLVLDELYPNSSLSLPFPALVESAFDRLVDANHSLSAGLLRTELDEQCGLWDSLDALQYVYLGGDLSILGAIDTKIFELMDRGRSWDDKFLLTEVTRSAFSVMPTIDLSRIVVRSAGTRLSDYNIPNRSVQVLGSISIDYILPWPVANIITQDAIQSYQRISTFLRQIRRAKYALVKERMRDARKTTAEDENETLIYALHHDLLSFLNSIYSHLTYLVISTSNQSLHSALSDVEDVDSMIDAHQAYMASLEDQCLLSENLSPIHDAVIALLDIGVHFADLQAVRAFEEGLIDPDDTRNIETLRQKRAAGYDSDSDSDEENDQIDHEQTLTISFRDSSYEDQMRNLKQRYDYLVSFVADGLKGVARADGLPGWNILADRLEWRTGWLR
ncbi:hypothetical protein N7532_007766 [Penicillium argentinense]|uniref:Spindle pole body component n=1 Tax=Penicillium argentinense TaxID=1131581 RepID=A0A9W9EW25_9EURO|nr:uncharacterized protein N7532_007766 [Penicillium argentinense]KAJ5089082.1 hypothetical protein N7532_007766 [Penicillium argentinense]